MEGEQRPASPVVRFWRLRAMSSQEELLPARPTALLIQRMERDAPGIEEPWRTGSSQKEHLERNVV